MECRNVIEPIAVQDFYQRVIRMKMEQWRLAQICAVRVEDGYEMSYSFCKDYDMVTIRLDLKEEEEVPSITQMYPCAFLQENEAAELFGVKITDIHVDYGDKLYRIDEKTPFKK